MNCASATCARTTRGAGHAGPVTQGRSRGSCTEPRGARRSSTTLLVCTCLMGPARREKAARRRGAWRVYRGDDAEDSQLRRGQIEHVRRLLRHHDACLRHVPASPRSAAPALLHHPSAPRELVRCTGLGTSCDVGGAVYRLSRVGCASCSCSMCTAVRHRFWSPSPGSQSHRLAAATCGLATRRRRTAVHHHWHRTAVAECNAAIELGEAGEL